MRISHDKRSDVMHIQFNDRPIETNRVVNDDFILDIDPDGNVVGIEILSASKHVSDPSVFDYRDLTSDKVQSR